MKLSTGLRSAMLGVSPLSVALAGGKIQIYSGTPPNTADDAIGSAGSNTLLCTISSGGTGAALEFAAATNGSISKSTTQTWIGTNIASGTATFARHVLATDTAALDASSIRIQATVGLSGADINMSSTALVANAPQTIDNYLIYLPTL
jgi:hypothetical protein